MKKNKSYRIKPAGRHILTIGRDLIQDVYAAVVELVKNAYDADSPDVNIEFRADPNHREYSIIISDHGHGMSRDTVINKWMVPSTRDKLDRRKSPSGRIMQGHKGVGRYAASILGTDLLLETVTAKGEKTSVFVEWKEFETAQYLNDVEVLIESAKVSEPAGTQLTINGDAEFLAEWTQKQFRKLQFELKKLKSPVSTVLGDDNFNINLKIDGFPDTENISETIEPYPIFEFFDYRIAGTVSSQGRGTLKYSIQKTHRAIAEEEEIPFDSGESTVSCGELILDIRVYDREKQAIDSLIGRGLKNKSGNYVGKNEARQLLNEFNGIGVYRNGFRIRPLGDADFDWLKLNEQRVQNPSLRIGSNQVIGYVQIQQEGQSGLIEKSARDGLRENEAFERLKEVTRGVIAKLEERRFDYRRKAMLSRPILKPVHDLERLFFFDELKRDVQTELIKSGTARKTTDKIIEIISREEDDKNKVAYEISQAVAIYQGQATLGKIINVILHEGRRPLSYFRNQIPNLKHWCDSYQKKRESHTLEKILLLIEGIGKNAEIFVKLFGRLDPLAAGKRTAKKNLELKKAIKETLSIFEEKMKSQGATFKITGPDSFAFFCWPQDIYAIFANLIDNSLYWMQGTKNPLQKITVEIVIDENSLLHIDYRDTGPGIEPSLIANAVIFEPQFSTKPSGTGLGLAIAGEAATRNSLELKALESEQGAWFRLQLKTENSEGPE